MKLYDTGVYLLNGQMRHSLLSTKFKYNLFCIHYAVPPLHLYYSLTHYLKQATRSCCDFSILKKLRGNELLRVLKISNHLII